MTVFHLQLLVLSKEYFDKSKINEIFAKITEERSATGHVKRRYRGAPPRDNCTSLIARACD
jgi:hypothetical protein